MSLQLRNFLLVLCLVFVSSDAWALREVFFKKQTTVYSKRSKQSNILTVFEKGERAPISAKKYGRWRKLVVEVDGRRTVGWVRARAIRGARIMEKQKPIDLTVYHHNKGVGFLGAFSYVTQGARTAASTAGVTANIDSLDGFSGFFGLLGDFPISETMSFRAEVLFRTSKRTGQGTFITPDIYDFKFNQSYTSFVGTAKFYGSRHSNFWYGINLEILKLNESEIVFNREDETDQTTVQEDIEKPIFAAAGASFGYDYRLMENFYLLPMFRLGMVLNSDPMVIVGELVVPIVYAF